MFMLSHNLFNPRELPFSSCTDYQLISEFTNSKSKLLDLFNVQSINVTEYSFIKAYFYAPHTNPK